MKALLISTALAATLSLPAYADHGQYKPFFNKENVGRMIGAGVGAILGAQVGRGDGSKAAAAAGAVGGYILGGKIGRDWKPRHSRNRYGHNDYREHKVSNYRPGKKYHKHSHYNKYHQSRTGYKSPITYMPELHDIDSGYKASRNSNVRGGPGMEYTVVDSLRHGERARVLGQVVGTNWYMIAQGGIIKGFVHNSLMYPAKRHHRNAYRPEPRHHNSHSSYYEDHREFAFN